ncbi:MAG: glycoside hydrolase family 3 C-terminal domain-containing protein [Eggerthellaceae bacterium]
MIRAADLTTEEKTRLLAGDDFWHSGSIPENVGPLRFSDGPHGLRKQLPDAESSDMEASYPATCFPTASALAASFDTSLLEQVGEALGQECRENEVDVLLGPGVNMKRDPRCGRNFEYFSEDPYLAGALAAAYIRGVQGQGVGTSLKHFAVNTQERKRMIADSIVDERALHELYLPAFEIAIREGHPWSVMLAYNRLNGIYCTENRALLDLARSWGFDGAFISDWGAMSQSEASVEAGMSLSMPGPRPDHILKIRTARANGILTEAALDNAADALLQLNARVTAGRQAHPAALESERAAARKHRLALARRAAEESAVLLKNDGILPLSPSMKLAVIGAFAEHPRFQGAGSSQVNPIALSTPLQALRAKCPDISYAPGYDAATGEATHESAVAAARCAQTADTVIVFLGQAPDSESEGYDRTTLRLPESQVRLLDALAEINDNLVAVLQCGAPIETDWRNRVRALVVPYLAGCECGSALAKLLFGEVNPSGKLAETWPERLADVPCGARGFPDEADRILHRESLFIGYRYYDAAQIPVAFPFGFGLSYTSFTYHDLEVDDSGRTVGIRITLTNTGDRTGAEAVQLYVAPLQPSAFRPPQELKGFQKTVLAPGESKTLHFDLGSRAFSHYSTQTGQWEVETGPYEIRIGASSRDIRARKTIMRNGTMPSPQNPALAPYEAVHPHGFSDEAFAVLLDRPLPDAMRPKRPFTIDSPVSDLAKTAFGRIVLRIVKSVAARIAGTGEAKAMLDHMLQEVPLRSGVLSGFLDFSRIEALVALLNHEGGVIAALKRNYSKRLR